MGQGDKEQGNSNAAKERRKILQGLRQKVNRGSATEKVKETWNGTIRSQKQRAHENRERKLSRTSSQIKAEQLGKEKGLEALLRAGVPEAFGKVVQESVNRDGGIYVARAGNRPRYELIIDPKAGNNLSKSSDQFTTQGFLVVDPNLGRMNHDGNPLGHHAKDVVRLILRDYPPKFSGNETPQLATQMMLEAQAKVKQKFAYSNLINQDTDIDQLIYDKFKIDVASLAKNRTQDNLIKISYQIEKEKQHVTDVPMTLHQILDGLKEGKIQDIEYDSKTNRIHYKQTGGEQVFSVKLDQPWQEQTPNYRVKGLEPQPLPANHVPDDIESILQLKEQGIITSAIYDRKTGLMEIQMKGDDRYIVLDNLGDFDLSARFNNLVKIDDVPKNKPGHIPVAVYNAVQQQLEHHQAINLTYKVEKFDGQHYQPVQCFANQEGGPPVSGDIDGLLKGAPKGTDPQYNVEYNTFEGTEQKRALAKASSNLLKKWKKEIKQKLLDGSHPPSKLDSIILDTKFSDLFSDTQLSRAGCTTPYQFLHMQMVNTLYKSHDQDLVSLFQHGYDMHNPYGCNAEGPSLLFMPDEPPIYVESQEMLCKILLDQLKDNIFQVNYGCDMTKGWGDIVNRQKELGQEVPFLTEYFYDLSKLEQAVKDANLNFNKPTNDILNAFDSLQKREAQLRSELKGKAHVVDGALERLNKVNPQVQNRQLPDGLKSIKKGRVSEYIQNFNKNTHEAQPHHEAKRPVVNAFQRHMQNKAPELDSKPTAPVQTQQQEQHQDSKSTPNRIRKK